MTEPESHIFPLFDGGIIYPTRVSLVGQEQSRGMMKTCAEVQTGWNMGHSFADIVGRDTHIAVELAYLHIWGLKQFEWIKTLETWGCI